MALDISSDPQISELAARLAASGQGGAANLISPPEAAPLTAPAAAPPVPVSAADAVAAQSFAIQNPTAPVGTVPVPTTPQTFQQKLATSAQQLGHDPSTPGSWARSLVASAVDALGAGNVGEAPAGSGWLYGATKAAQNLSAQNQNRQQMAAAQKQQDIANQREDKKLDLEKQKTAAIIAEANAHEHNLALMNRNADEDHQTKVYESAQKMAEPIKSAGAPELGHGLIAEQLKEQIKNKQLDPSAVYSFVDGHVPVVDAKGNPVLDKDGLPQRQETRVLYGPIPNVVLGKEQADMLNKYAPLAAGSWTEKQSVPGDAYYLTVKRAQLAQGVDLNMQHVKAEIAQSQNASEREKAQTREANLSVEQKQQNIQAMKLFAPFLAGADGDPVIALQNMSRDPKGKQNVGAVEQAYGPGNIGRFRTDAKNDLRKAIDSDSKTLAEHAKEREQQIKDAATANQTPPPIDSDRADEDKQILSHKNAAQQRLNEYSGLHFSDKPQFEKSIQSLEGYSLEEQSRMISSQKNMSDVEKSYTRRAMGLPANAPAGEAPWVGQNPLDSVWQSQTAAPTTQNLPSVDTSTPQYKSALEHMRANPAALNDPRLDASPQGKAMKAQLQKDLANFSRINAPTPVEPTVAP